MKFEEYLATECSSRVGEKFWSEWSVQSKIRLLIAFKHGYKDFNEKSKWCKEYCNGYVYLGGSWIFFELEEDFILFTMKWM